MALGGGWGISVILARRGLLADNRSPSLGEARLVNRKKLTQDSKERIGLTRLRGEIVIWGEKREKEWSKARREGEIKKRAKPPQPSRKRLARCQSANMQSPTAITRELCSSRGKHEGKSEEPRDLAARGRIADQ